GSREWRLLVFAEIYGVTFRVCRNTCGMGFFLRWYLRSWTRKIRLGRENRMQQPDGPRITYVTLPLPDGPVTVPIITIPACTWLVPDMTDGIHDAVECGAAVLGRECADGHSKVGGLTAFNPGPAEL